MLVYSNQEYENVTTSANNLVLWQKLKTSKGKITKLVKRWVYEQLLGIYTLFLTRTSKRVYCS